MSNRWRQGLFNRINEKQEEINGKKELDHKDLMRVEELDNIREELVDKPILNDAEFELFESKIEAV